MEKISKKKKEPKGKSIFDNIFDVFRLKKKDETSQQEPLKSDIIEQKIKCSCPKTKSNNYCDSIYEIIQMNEKNKNIDSRNSILLYQGLLSIHERGLDSTGENIIQIKKDLPRTFPTCLIMKTEKIKYKLKNVLRAFSNYDPSLKYYQGMNFIVGSFLYHCDEHIAFWLFISLLEEYNYRFIFFDNFSGLSVHISNVKKILKKYNEKYYNTLLEIGVNFEIFMIEWIYSLFSNIIPLDLQIKFYKGFFCEGWKFFYKMCISIMTSVKATLKGPEELYLIFKFGTLDDNISESFTFEYWKKIIHKAYEININDCL
jgi:hypothetical protein